ncbi:hypothetical protein HII28_04835 [Planctomonas sp. JC2975]|uniref:hypothetical protein n=1 Tax=Planctomonas sp. JC2975 TaxID=2729626 RepID=UPI0014728B93|nr:hypothetical protein [Planctomonas sp. JC2975]NNC11203.1 hypothetical protein [Planctomonas sp. JC2975]
MPASRARVLIIGRSPTVLTGTVELLRRAGYAADATNRFDSVLDDYDPARLDLVVFGGMVPADAKGSLRDEIGRRNPAAAFVQGLVGIPGVIAAQVEAAADSAVEPRARLEYDASARTLRVSLDKPARVILEAFWMTSWTPPEPTSTFATITDGELAEGVHDIPLPPTVPDEASFATLRAGDSVHVLTIGALPTAIGRMAPKSIGDQRLPTVGDVTTHDGRAG